MKIQTKIKLRDVHCFLYSGVTNGQIVNITVYAQFESKLAMSIQLSTVNFNLVTSIVTTQRKIN